MKTGVASQHKSVPAGQYNSSDQELLYNYFDLLQLRIWPAKEDEYYLKGLKNKYSYQSPFIS